MSVQIKSLTNSTPVVDNNSAAAPDTFNIIPSPGVYSLYSAPNASPTIKAAIVKSIRLINTSASAVTVTLWLNRPVGVAYRRRNLTPTNMSLPPNFVYVDDSELTMEPGDIIQAQVSANAAVQYLFSGVERDAS